MYSSLSTSAGLAENFSRCEDGVSPWGKNHSPSCHSSGILSCAPASDSRVAPLRPGSKSAKRSRPSAQRASSSGSTGCMPDNDCGTLPLCSKLKAPAQSPPIAANRSEEHTSELQSREKLVCRLLLEKNK